MEFGRTWITRRRSEGSTLLQYHPSWDVCIPPRGLMTRRESHPALLAPRVLDPKPPQQLIKHSLTVRTEGSHQGAQYRAIRSRGHLLPTSLTKDAHSHTLGGHTPDPNMVHHCIRLPGFAPGSSCKTIWRSCLLKPIIPTKVCH